MLIDVEERRALTEERDRALTELRLIADALPLLVAFVDRTLTYQFANAAYQEWFGLSPREVVGRTIPEIAGEAGYAVRRTAIERALTGEPVRMDLDWPWQDGRRRIADIRYLPRHDARGAVDGFYIFVQDVTVLRDAAAVLSTRNATLEGEAIERMAELRLYRDIVLSDAAPILAFDRDHRLIGFNQAHADEFSRLMGHRQMIGEVLPDLFPPAQAELLRGLMDRALAGERFVVTEEFGDPERGVPTWEITYTPLRDATGTIVGAFHHARDISERTRIERERDRLEEQLRQSQKMEAVGQLTGGLAHDFNNLLAGISGSLELTNTRINQGRLKDVEKYMIAAQGAAKRAAALTHRLLALSRRQTLQPRATNVNTLVSGMLDLIQRTVGPSVQVETVAMAGLWPALVDASQLENALLNLCINARDAMPGGGKITIETGNRWIDRHGAKQHDMPEGQYLSLCVSDTGTGMPPEVIAKAFDPFFTTKPIGEGTGLGLSMIYGFAKQSGGQARIYSEVGEGTMVCLYLPRHRGEAEHDEVLPEAALLPVAEAGETVLIVDDEPTVRMLVADVLGDLGYTAIEAADGVGGLKVLQSNARIDLLVSDVGLPGGMNGRQMADAARVGRPDLKVLFITGFAENALLNNGQLEPGMSVLTKPFAVDTLAARIRELITK
ncbi:hybrid sensor histidine kinase/response regulator [Methylobacterium radiotolerans]|uniref:hybrid sensor histidine kinase/response regulator n=1 Tax=Methylobacterium radiotolerans TaxID=31998 RepID=UPI00399C8E48